MSELIRVLVANHHPLIRRGLTTLIASEPGMESVGDSTTAGVDLMVQTDLFQPDVIIMDIKTFYQDDFKAVRQLKTSRPHIRILVLSGLEDNYVYPVKQISYLPFDASSTALVEAIRQAYQGKGFPFPATATDSMIH